MDQIIKVVNQLQDIFTALKIPCPFDLPQIAVVGEQSAGKSSVLEAFVGRDFLPRGSGIVTRRPLVLQLTNHQGAEYAEFLHIKGKKFGDFLEVRNEISRETDRVTGKNKNISPIPINLRIYSPHVVNLTLIDLPGITKVPVGDQPADIEKQIKEMILSYVGNTNCLILAVIPANIDLANSEALKLAREVDPERMRTIGVLSKIDMMDGGTDCLEILRNKVYPLGRGFVGVVNRSQRDIESQKDISASQTAEMQFFSDHPRYRTLGESVGSGYLQKTLNTQLGQHIKQTLPQLKQSVSDELSQLQSAIDRDPELYNDNNDGASVYRILMLKVQQFTKKVEGELGYTNEDVGLDVLSSGARLSRLMCQRFLYEIEKTKPLPELLKKQIRYAIWNSQGMAEGVFSAGGPFLAVMRQHIRTTETPCLRILDLVTREVCDMVDRLASETFSHYPELLAQVSLFLAKGIGETNRTARQFLEFMIDIQVEHINTNHPDFLVAQDPLGTENKVEHRRMVTAIENVIHKQGPLVLTMPGLMKGTRDCYVVLRGQMVFIYKDMMKKDLRDQTLLSECRIKDTSSRQKALINVSRKDGQNLTKNFKTFDFVCKNSEDLESWKESFVSAGLELDRSDEITSDAQVVEDQLDQELVKQINYVHLLVESYLQITVKSLQDTVAKVCVSCIISKLRGSMMADLVVHLYSFSNLEDLFKKSEQALAERDKTLNLYKSCKEAIVVINAFINSADLDSSITANLPIFSVSSKSQSRLTSAPTVRKPTIVDSRSQSSIMETPRSFQPMKGPTASTNNQDAPKPQPFGAKKKPRRPPPSSAESIFYAPPQ